MSDIKKILVVDDEPKIVEVVEAYLRKEGFNVLTAGDGEKALKLFKEEVIHLVVLDLMLPKVSGEEVCNRIRATSDVPIIMLTAKSEEDDKIEGLAIGADDYLTKPFSARELVGRVKALIRRSYRESSPLADYLIFNNGDLEVDINKMKVKKAGLNINLTTNEFKILLALLTNPGQVFSREQLVQKAFGVDYEGFDRTIDSHIKNIRQKIEDNHKEPKYIITVYGMGYKFVD
ncbi:response regulator transcription factor [Clostridium magnum]|uniref:Stage 0 sporulation protein A homolog n=1 Tax=Clostridium magnum DSM 2767 TaxID=1121326 RepID=A0A162TQT8_9CLOT|nr:response regulator transcription factor [Clostridium magnum]KZL92934.1 sensory transduction protein regX3 [Clostridium magnum DSM 2767]SHJ16940.1 DNA-binding response regulator, OmpR family, contains REC and winged-helix (wHTH) domain [Clostridium magnum DSM 2767]